MKERFYFNEFTNSFIGEIEILNQNIEFEIKSKEPELNWVEIERFVAGLDDDYIPKINDTSSKLLLEFIKLVPFGVQEPFSSYDFRLEAIVYYGKVNNPVFSELSDGFELVFKLYHSDYVECDDPYGNYFVKVDNRLITGVRREQV
ncbi:hypothetical protein [Spirosoma foliorum]|uniref:Uncharacterized protein n=1 Tax=Spirosoma foliorum TaxID=2710596 RepID=A0A7G5GWT4_9BACT|nr:hypothetical protein [Spirosoma foliorum]QMW03326.1 hypothetical protein H3H32_36655 [Spirosoma foliorum]